MKITYADVVLISRLAKERKRQLIEEQKYIEEYVEIHFEEKDFSAEMLRETKKTIETIQAQIDGLADFRDYCLNLLDIEIYEKQRKDWQA